ncbi:MAG: cupin domain-containing protein [Erysipelotrichaceae bacterium]|nr:cupin domain-containing protein [Erysipelotrichaceae bacterium]
MLKNIDKNVILNLKDQVSVLENQVVSKTLVQNNSVGMTLFAFDKDTMISSHKSTGDAFVQILEGEATLTVGDVKHDLKEGETLIMPATIPHAVYAKEKFKMLLTVIF